jgi:hypothetical protein
MVIMEDQNRSFDHDCGGARRGPGGWRENRDGGSLRWRGIDSGEPQAWTLCSVLCTVYLGMVAGDAGSGGTRYVPLRMSCAGE